MLEKDPFQSIDTTGVGSLVGFACEMGCEMGRDSLSSRRRRSSSAYAVGIGTEVQGGVQEQCGGVGGGGAACGADAETGVGGLAELKRGAIGNCVEVRGAFRQV